MRGETDPDGATAGSPVEAKPEPEQSPESNPGRRGAPDFREEGEPKKEIPDKKD